MSSEEQFEIVTEEGEVIGLAPRSQCHGDPSLLHQVAHVLVMDPNGRIALQLRAAHKDIQPDLWDTSVGGHVSPGETVALAAHREMFEELGIKAELTFLYRYIWRTEIESELVSTYRCLYQGDFAPDPKEVAEVRWWTPQQIEAELDGDMLTPNFCVEWRRYQALKS